MPSSGLNRWHRSALLASRRERGRKGLDADSSGVAQQSRERERKHEPRQPVLFGISPFQPGLRLRRRGVQFQQRLEFLALQHFLFQQGFRQQLQFLPMGLQ